MDPINSRKRIEANRRNARRATGPRTAEGKGIASRNALRHGLLSGLQVLPLVERQADWDAHLEATLEDLRPAGYLEEVLAERVAFLLWRLGRVARYERATLVDGLSRVEVERAHVRARAAREDLAFVASLPARASDKPVDPGRAAALIDGVAETAEVDIYGAETDVEFPDYPDGAPMESLPWTAAHVLRCLEVVANHAGKDLPEIMELRVEQTERHQAAQENKLRERLVPGIHELGKSQRYETTMERSFYRALHELQRLQAARIGAHVPAPVAVDVTVGGGHGG